MDDANNKPSQDGIVTFREVCPRCKQAIHEKLPVFKFTEPVPIGGVAYTHWCYCPILNEPALIVFREDK